MSNIDLNANPGVPEEPTGIGVQKYEIDLLSKGKLTSPSSIEIKSMTAKEEDILANPTFIKNGSVFNKLLNSILLTKVNSGEMLVGDRDWILLNTRIDAYGSEYEIEIECPGCGEKSQVTYDLGTTQRKNLEIDPDETGMNQFSVSTPGGYDFVLGFWTVAMQDRLDAYLKNTKQKSPITSKLFIQTVSLNGETDRQEIRDAIESLPAKDSLFLRRWISENAPGVILEVDFTCEQCGHFEGGTDVPMGTSFFWPDVD